MRKVIREYRTSSRFLDESMAETFELDRQFWLQFRETQEAWVPAEKARAEAMGVRILCYEDESYPLELKNIDDCPVAIYVRGKMPDWNRAAVAIVGTRKPTAYGKRMAEKIAGELAAAGVVVVSGMAEGIDALAHQGAIDAGGETLAVLGSGVDEIYPPVNERLYWRIVDNGAVISELPLGSPPRKYHFPARNRLIAALSRLVLVVEAGLKSGSLITAKRALEQGKDVAALPGNVTSPLSEGTNKLIKDGAMLVERSADILEALSLEAAALARSQLPLPQLDDIAIQVYDAVGVSETTLEDIIRVTGLKAGEVLASLTLLELQGVVERASANSYVKSRQ